MIKWAPLHFVRLVLALAAGILTYVYSGWHHPAALWLLAAAAAVFVALYLHWGRSPAPQRKALLGLSAIICCFFFGMALTFVRTGTSWPDHLIHIQQPVEAYIGTIDDYVIRKERSLKTYLKVEAVLTGKEWQRASGTVLLLVPRDTASLLLHYGDRLLVKGQPELLKGPTNPGEFDYRRYLHFHNIFHRQFAKTGSFHKLDYDPSNQLIALAFRLREHFTDVYRQYITGTREKALAIALVLGIKDDLDNALMRAYSSAGAMHVLAVSGLHVAIVYEVLDMLLKRLGQQRRRLMIRTVIGLSFIWLYTLITGFSSSVLRAAVMFSFVIIGKAFGRQHAVYNTLALSAFALLAYNPYLIMEVGFQLSYLAVLGIVYLHPKLYRLWDPRTWLMDKIWAISCVSMAAQLATFPLGLLYFHQFPLYFLVSNLFVIPASTIVLYMGMLLLLVSPVEWLAHWVGKGVSGSIWVMNKGMFLTEELPYSLLQGIDITIAETWLLYGGIGFLLAFLQTRRVHYFYYSLALLLVFSMVNMREVLVRKQKGRFVVYDIRRTAAIEFLGAHQGVFVADSSLVNDPFGMQFYIWRNWWEQDVLHPAEVALQPSAGSSLGSFSTRLPDQNLLLCLGGHKALLVWKPLRMQPQQPVPVDYLVLLHQVRVNLPDLLSAFPARHLIIDSSSKPWYQQKIAEQARQVGQKVHLVSAQGAFIEEFTLNTNQSAAQPRRQ